MDIEKYKAEIKSLEGLFIGRLDRALLRDAIEYVDHNECSLALETLCDYLGDQEVRLTADEYQTLLTLCEKSRIDSRRVLYLNRFVSG